MATMDISNLNQSNSQSPFEECNQSPNQSHNIKAEPMETDEEEEEAVDSSTEAKGKSDAAHHQTEAMSNSQLPLEVAIVPEILKKLDSTKTDHKITKYFEYYRGEQIGEQKGKQMAKCRVCDKIYTRSNGSTKATTYHLKRTHPQFWEMYDKAKKQNELKKQQKKEPDGSGNQLFK
jgi:hypothetical protein